MENDLKACMIGLGYVGLPGAAVFAAAGVNMVGVDINQHAVDTINAGSAHIVEPGLDEILSTVVTEGKLRATTQVEQADVFLIAVPTPFKGDKVPDLRFVEAATRTIAPHLKAGDLVILESTSPVGTTQQIANWLAELRTDLTLPAGRESACNIFVAHCPERILPGNVLHEIINNDRVIGGLTPACTEAAAAFYKIAVKGHCHLTTAATAEMCKLTENAFRDVNIAFANEVSLICDRLDIDVRELISLTNQHPRVNVLQPGTGVGGHCIAVDPWFIIDSAPDLSRLMRTAREVNDAKPHWVVDKIVKGAQANERADGSIACFGLAYKPDVDDFRESPSVEVVDTLANAHSGPILVFEPFIEQLPETLESRNIRLVGLDEAMQADFAVILTGHSQFREIDFATHSAEGRFLDPTGAIG